MRLSLFFLVFAALFVATAAPRASAGRADDPSPARDRLPAQVRDEIDCHIAVFRGLDDKRKQDSAHRLAGLGQRTVPYLLRVLPMLADEPSRWIVRTFHHLRDARCVPVLIVRYGHASDELKEEILAALVSMREPSAIPFLTSVLDETGDARRCMAATALARLRDPRAAEALIRALESDDWWVRAEGVAGLRQIHGKLELIDLPERLIRSLAGLSAEQRADTIRLLASLRDPRAVEPIGDYLRLGTAEVRCVCARALGFLGDPLAVHRLERALDDEAAGVRLEAIRSLAAIKGTEVFALLVQHLAADPSSEVRLTARRVLGRLVGRDLGPKPDRWLEWIEER